MEFILEEFVARPSIDQFHRCTKEQLCVFVIADHFDVVSVSVCKQLRKQEIKNVLWSAFFNQWVLPCDTAVQVMSSQVAKPNSEEMLRLRELSIEMHRLYLKEKELNNELELRKMEEETKRHLHLTELDLRQSSWFVFIWLSFWLLGINKYIRLVPYLCERDIDKYFILFECVADTSKWPRNVWSLLLQCVYR